MGARRAAAAVLTPCALVAAPGHPATGGPLFYVVQCSGPDTSLRTIGAVYMAKCAGIHRWVPLVLCWLDYYTAGPYCLSAMAPVPSGAGLFAMAVEGVDPSPAC